MILSSSTDILFICTYCNYFQRMWFNDMLEVLKDSSGSFMSDKQREVITNISMLDRKIGFSKTLQ